MKYALIDSVGVVCGITTNSKVNSRFTLIEVDDEQASELRTRPKVTTYQAGRYITSEKSGRWVYRWDSCEFDFVES